MRILFEENVSKNSVNHVVKISNDKNKSLTFITLCMLSEEQYGAPCVKLRNIKFCIIFLVNFG